MSDRVYINYQGIDAFLPQPTPLVGVEYADIYYGERWGQQETFTLQGQLTGCSYSGIVQAQRDLLNRFNKSFQTLEIWQQTGALSNLVYSKPFTEVQSVTFPQSRMFGAQEYTVTLTCYPSGLFSGAWGILDPQDTWDFKEQADATLDVTHTISCKAFNTSAGNNNAIDNARTWAFGRTGTNTTIYPILISGVSPTNFCLLSQTENIDRFNGTYSLTENYTNDLARTGYGVIRYTADVQSGNNLVTVSLNGNAQGCGRNITGLRYAYGRIDKVAVAAKVYRDTFGMTDLNPVPLTQSFTEDAFTTRIDFAYVFNNDNSSPIVFDYSVDCSTATNGFITAAIQGTVRARAGNLVDRLIQTQAYANTIDLYGLTLPFYNVFDISSIAPLNPVPTVSGRSISQSEGTTDLNATFTNQTKVSPILDSFVASLDFQPQVEKVDSKPKLNGLGQYSAVDLGYANRAALSINGNAVVNIAYSSVAGAIAVKQACFALFTQYGRYANVTLDQNQITTNRTDDKTLSFTFAWSFDSPNIIGPTTVGSLSV